MPQNKLDSRFAFAFGLITALLVLALVYILLAAPAEYALWGVLIILPLALIFFTLTVRLIK